MILDDLDKAKASRKGGFFVLDKRRLRDFLECLSRKTVMLSAFSRISQSINVVYRLRICHLLANRLMISNSIGKNIYAKINHGRLACSNLDVSLDRASKSFMLASSILRLCMALLTKTSNMAIVVAAAQTIAIHIDWLLCRTKKNETILAIQRTIGVVMFILLGYDQAISLENCQAVQFLRMNRL